MVNITAARHCRGLFYNTNSSSCYLQLAKFVVINKPRYLQLVRQTGKDLSSTVTNILNKLLQRPGFQENFNVSGGVDRFGCVKLNITVGRAWDCICDAAQQLHPGTTLQSIKTSVSGKLKMVKFRKLGSKDETQARRHNKAEKKREAAKHDEESSQSSSSEDDKNSDHVHSSSKQTQTCGASQKITTCNGGPEHQERPQLGIEVQWLLLRVQSSM